MFHFPQVNVLSSVSTTDQSPIVTVNSKPAVTSRGRSGSYLVSESVSE